MSSSFGRSVRFFLSITINQLKDIYFKIKIRHNTKNSMLKIYIFVSVGKYTLKYLIHIDKSDRILNNTGKIFLEFTFTWNRLRSSPSFVYFKVKTYGVSILHANSKFYGAFIPSRDRSLGSIIRVYNAKKFCVVTSSHYNGGTDLDENH